MTPDPNDLVAWRERMAAARGRDAQQATFTAWASAAGCTVADGDASHVWTPPDTLDPRTAIALHAWALLAGMHMRPPLGSWAARHARLKPPPELTKLPWTPP